MSLQSDYIEKRNSSLENPYGEGGAAYQEMLNLLAAGNTEQVADWLSQQGDIWAQKVAANPALGINYKQSWWQRLGSSLGFRTGYDKFLEQQQSASKQYIADLLDQYYQQEFNKPASQVEQMRQAGLNPDLLGTGDVSQAPKAATDNDGMDPSAFEGGTAGEAVNVISTIGSQISSAMSTLQSAIGSAFNFQGLAEDLRSKKVANGNGLLGLASSLLGKYSPATLGFTDDDSAGWSDIMNDSIDPSTKRVIMRNLAAQKLGLSKKDLSRVVGLMTDMLPMLGGQQIVHEGQAKLGEVRGKNVMSQASQFKNPSYMSDKQMWHALKPIQEYEDETIKQYYKFAREFQNLQLKQTQNQITYENTYDPASDATLYNLQVGNRITYERGFDAGLAADVSNVTNEIAKLQAEWTKTFKQAQNAMLEKVQRSARDGNFFSQLMLNSIIASGFITDTGIGNVITGAVNIASRGLAGAGAFLKGANSGPAQHTTYDTGTTFINSYH